MPAPKGNRFAAKDASEKVTASLFVRLTDEEKDFCVGAAGDMSVSSWARKTLLDAAKRERAASDQRPAPGDSKRK